MSATEPSALAIDQRIARLWMEERFGVGSVRQTPHAGFEVEDTLYPVGPVTWLDALPPFVMAAGVGAPLFLLWTLRDAARRSKRR